MLRRELLLILPLVVAVTVGQANGGYSYYGTSNVRYQRPQPIYGRPLVLPGRPMPAPGPTTAAPLVPAVTAAPTTPAVTAAPETPAAPVPFLDGPGSPNEASAPAAPASALPLRPVYYPVSRPLLPPRPIRPGPPVVASPLPAVTAASQLLATEVAPPVAPVEVIQPQPPVEQPEPAQTAENVAPTITSYEPGKPIVIEPLPGPVSTVESAPVPEQPPAPEPIQPSVEPEPILQPKPIREPQLIPQPEPISQPIREPEPVLLPAPISSPEPIQEPEPVLLPAPISSPEPILEPEPVLLPVPIPLPEPIRNPEPILEPKPILKPEPIREPQPIREPEPVLPTEPIRQPEPILQPQPISQPELAQQPELVRETEPVSQTEPAPQPEPIQDIVPSQGPAVLMPLPKPASKPLNTFHIIPPQSDKPVALLPLVPKPQPIRETGFGRHPQPSGIPLVTYPTQTPSYSYPTPSRTVPTQAIPVYTERTYPVAVVTTQAHLPVTQAPGHLKSDFQCKEGNGYYSVEHECDSYIECKQDRAMKYSCPDGLHFNPAAKPYEYPCAYPSEVKCMAGDQEQDSKPSDKCPNQYGFYSMNDGDCSRFIMCQEGLATIMNCPMGLAFNPQTSSCDWPANVPQCNPNVFKDFTCPAPPEDEDGQISGIIYKYRYGVQCKLYIACQLGHPRLLSCERGLSFDETSQSCIDEDYVADCAVPYSEHLQ